MKVARRAPLVLAIILLAIPLRVHAQVYAGQLGMGLYSPSPYQGPLAPDFGGDTGLFTIPTGDVLPARAFSFSLYAQNLKLVAGEDPNFPAEDRQRLYNDSTFRGSLAYGIANHLEIFVSAGEKRAESRGGWTTGVINGQEYFGHFDLTDPAKIRLGAKVSMWEAGSRGRLALYTAAFIPVANDQDFVETRRTDWEFGASGSIGIFTGNVDYTLSGRRSTDPDVRVPNHLRFAFGTDVPFGPVHWISELDRNIYDNASISEGSPDIKTPDWSYFATGVRIFFGHSGWGMSAALNANVDQLVRHGFSPTPVGGIIGVHYAPFPAPPPPPRPLPPPAAAATTEETTAEVAPEPPPPAAVEAPAPPAAPPAPQTRTTTDTIGFDKGGTRLTNIAKAILDGVALRMKNDLNSTAVITGYSDNSGSEDANLKISAERAEAAKAYLVERHGIDGARIKTAGRGSADPVADNGTEEGRAKNRRAVIVVTLVSGS
ncbi:MAG TPA: OmpA family protein [Thermoanaerobaculia bacterium]|nr:OmpA family protein [Thermoanaerobaculia bacterium]